jgi:spore germination protein YaaH
MMRFFFTFLFTVSLSINIFSQEEISIHKLHSEEFGLREKPESFYPENGEGIIPLQFEKSSDLTKTVFGYLPDWEYQTARHNLDYSLLTHIAAFDFVVSSNGSMTNPGFWPWTDVINEAHSNGVKVILTAVNFTNSDIRNIMTNAAAKQNFFTNVKNRIVQYQLDGVNVDFESLYTADRGSILNNFMQDLTNYIHTELPGKEVSFAGPAVNWGGWDLQGLANSCDYIFIMGYAFYGSFSNSTGPTSPLTGGSINITNTVNVQYASPTQNTPEKLILGIPYYGLKWKTQTNLPHSQVVSWVSSTRFKNDVSDVLTHGLLWASDNQTPWYRYQLNNEWHQVWYDNDSSLGLKYDLAEAKNYKGVGMWALGYDGERQELWNELRRRYYFVPVELTSFTANSSGNSVELKWETSTEKNNRGFEIERSKTISENVNEEWITIGFTEGSGTTTEKKSYFFVDKNIDAGKYNYRLKQFDFDGSFEYSNVIETDVFYSFGYSLEQSYPNPFNPTTKIKYSIPTAQNLLPGEASGGLVTLIVYDMLGSEVATLVDEKKSAGIYEVDFDAGSLSSGLYFYRLKAGNFSSTKKMLLVR